MPRLATTKQRKTCTNHGRAFSQAVNWKLLLHVASRKGAEQRRRASTRVVLQLHHLCSSCCRTAVPAFFLWPIWSYRVADIVCGRYGTDPLPLCCYLLLWNNGNNNITECWAHNVLAELLTTVSWSFLWTTASLWPEVSASSCLVPICLSLPVISETSVCSSASSDVSQWLEPPAHSHRLCVYEYCLRDTVK